MATVDIVSSNQRARQMYGLDQAANTGTDVQRNLMAILEMDRREKNDQRRLEQQEFSHQIRLQELAQGQASEQDRMWKQQAQGVQKLYDYVGSASTVEQYNRRLQGATIGLLEVGQPNILDPEIMNDPVYRDNPYMKAALAYVHRGRENDEQVRNRTAMEQAKKNEAEARATQELTHSDPASYANYFWDPSSGEITSGRALWEARQTVSTPMVDAHMPLPAGGTSVPMAEAFFNPDVPFQETGIERNMRVDDFIPMDEKTYAEYQLAGEVISEFHTGVDAAKAKYIRDGALIDTSETSGLSTRLQLNQMQGGMVIPFVFAGDNFDSRLPGDVPISLDQRALSMYANYHPSGAGRKARRTSVAALQNLNRSYIAGSGGNVVGKTGYEILRENLDMAGDMNHLSQLVNMKGAANTKFTSYDGETTFTIRGESGTLTKAQRAELDKKIHAYINKMAGLQGENIETDSYKLVGPREPLAKAKAYRDFYITGLVTNPAEPNPVTNVIANNFLISTHLSYENQNKKPASYTGPVSVRKFGNRRRK